MYPLGCVPGPRLVSSTPRYWCRTEAPGIGGSVCSRGVQGRFTPRPREGLRGREMRNASESGGISVRDRSRGGGGGLFSVLREALRLQGSYPPCTRPFPLADGRYSSGSQLTGKHCPSDLGLRCLPAGEFALLMDKRRRWHLPRTRALSRSKDSRRAGARLSMILGVSPSLDGQ